MNKSVNALRLKRRRLQALATVAAGAISLTVAGCQTDAQSGKRASLAAATISAKGVPVALESIDGVPNELAGHVKSAIVTQASARSMEVVAPGQSARFRVRGYITAYGNDAGGTAVSFVWDVFDSTQARAQRVTATITTPGSDAGDAWAHVDERQLDLVSRKGIDELALFLASKSKTAGGPAEPESSPTQPVMAYTPQ